MKILNWLKKKEIKTEFEKVFSDLKRVGEILHNAKTTYYLLKDLNSKTDDSQSDELINELKQIRYSSNTNNYFYFYFPIVTHILFYKPQYEEEILNYLIGPNFANGDSEAKELIPLIQQAMEYKLSENKNYLTKESQEWIMNDFPKMINEVEREVQKCWKELNE